MNLTYLLPFVLACLAFTGCAQPEADPAPVFDLAMATAPVGAYETDCSRVFSPTPEAEPYVQAAVARWSRATGCDVRIGDGGIPVAMSDNIVTEEGDRMTGVSNRNGCEVYEIFIARYSVQPAAVTVHEVGHSLQNPCGPNSEVHAPSGIMTYNSSEDVIDEASLSLVCEGFDCRAFNVEP